MPVSLSRPGRDPSSPSTEIVLREARRLHRAATSDSPAAALPVLRRLLAARAVPACSLPSLFNLRSTVQRKHVLRTLAVEAGFDSWESYSRALPRIDAALLQQAFEAGRDVSQLRRWFASPALATQYAAKRGGQVVPMGGQAVVLGAAEAAASQAETGGGQR